MKRRTIYKAMIAAAAALLVRGGIFLATAAPSAPVAVPGRVVIVDGDTLDIAGERIRLLGPDAPESHESRCEAELVVALKAKARLRALVDEAEGPLLLERHGRDRYGRTLARVYVRRVGRSVEVGDVLMTEGLAVQWRPGRAAWLVRAQHWCPSFTEGGE